MRDQVGLPGGAVVKNLPASGGDARDAGSIPGWGRSPGGGNGNPLQYSCWGNSMQRGARWGRGWVGMWGHKGSDTAEHARTATLLSVL